MMPITLPEKPKKALNDLPQHDRDVMAEAARRMLREEVFQRTTTALRSDCLELLAKTDPSDTQRIIELQAMIKAIDGLNTKLLEFSHGATRAPMKVI